jgi:hypothetical protein
VLDSTSPIEGVDLLGRLPQLALPRVLRELCFPPACAATFGPSPSSGSGPPRCGWSARPSAASVVLASGRSRTLTLRQADLSAVVGASDVDLLARAEMLAAADGVARGDGAPARPPRRPAHVGGGSSSGVNEIRFLATACVEAVDLPWRPDDRPGPSSGPPRWTRR